MVTSSNKILIIDDHPLVLQGCRRVLEDAGITGVFEAANFEDGERLYKAFKPAVIIVDLAMSAGGLHGLAFIERLRLHDETTRILVLTMHSDPVIVLRALEAGANGYVLKDMPSEEFLRAFEKVRGGSSYLSGDLASQIAFVRTRTGANPLGAMSGREVQILTLLADGKSYNEIAYELNVSYKTIANICSQLKLKLGVNKLSDLIRIALMRFPQSR
jgi:two-component system invasion response regulator UvrY